MSVALVTMGTIKDPMFVLVAGFYLIAIGIAYKIGSKIEDYATNAAYNWSIKWLLFITFLYLSGVYINNAFVYAMFLFILINIVIRPTLFVVKGGVKT
jgi:hypothetical protein